MTIKKYLTLPIAFSLLAIGFTLFYFTSIAHATHSWGGYHWARTTTSFNLKLGDNVSTAWDAYLASASNDWSTSLVLDTTVVIGQSKGNCQPTTGRVEVCNKTYGNNGWLGVASIWASGTHITQGTVKLNDTYFNTARYNTPAWKQFVACQEIGHTFGLDHQDVNFNNTNLGTCMDYTNDPTGTAGTNGKLDNEHPNTHDYDELALIYAHPDGSTTVAPQTVVPLRGKSAVIDATDVGAVIRTDSKGRPALYERDLGKGDKLFTFVLWAE